MFNVSALLLDDAFLKHAHTKSSCFNLLLLTHISQGSVMTHLRSGGIFSDSIFFKRSCDSNSEISLKLVII